VLPGPRPRGVAWSAWLQSVPHRPSRDAYAHQTEVRDGGGLRELPRRAGRSPLRASYRRLGKAFVIVAIGPEAEVDKRGFQRAVSLSNKRLSVVKKEGTQRWPEDLKKQVRGAGRRAPQPCCSPGVGADGARESCGVVHRCVTGPSTVFRRPPSLVSSA